jgi:hypothetical protein
MTAKFKVRLYIEKEFVDEDLSRAEMMGYDLIREIREVGNDSEFDQFESNLDVTWNHIPNGLDDE